MDSAWIVLLTHGIARYSTRLVYRTKHLAQSEAHQHIAIVVVIVIIMMMLIIIIIMTIITVVVIIMMMIMIII